MLRTRQNALNLNYSQLWSQIISRMKDAQIEQSPTVMNGMTI